MSEKVPGWIKGVGIGCGVCILLVVGLFAASYFYLKTNIRDFEETDQSFEQLAERFGPASEFIPDPTGSIPGERMELFLKVRERTGAERAELEDNLLLLSGDVGRFRKMMAGVELPGDLSGFIRDHNQALIKAGMSPVEYDYIYVIAYYGLLGKDLADGPSFKLVNEHGYVLDQVINEPESAARERRERLAREGINHRLLHVLRSQSEVAAGSDLWQEKLFSEVAAMEADGLRIPWQDGLPDEVAGSLEPYRERLDESYSVMLNALEAGLARRID